MPKMSITTCRASEDRTSSKTLKKIRQERARKYLGTEEQYLKYVAIANKLVRKFGLDHRTGALNTDGESYVRDAYIGFINGRRKLPKINPELEIIDQEEDQWKRFMLSAIHSRIMDENRKVSIRGNKEVQKFDDCPDRASLSWSDNPQLHSESLQNLMLLIGNENELQGSYFKLWIFNDRITNDDASVALNISVNKVKLLRKQLSKRLRREFSEYLHSIKEKPD